jgi:hypothetical protein
MKQSFRCSKGIPSCSHSLAARSVHHATFTVTAELKLDANLSQKEWHVEIFSSPAGGATLWHLFPPTHTWRGRGYEDYTYELVISLSPGATVASGASRLSRKALSTRGQRLASRRIVLTGTVERLHAKGAIGTGYY